MNVCVGKKDVIVYERIIDFAFIVLEENLKARDKIKKDILEFKIRHVNFN